MKEEFISVSREKLREFSGDHLYYEITMLYGATQKLEQGAKDIVVYKALLESFVNHASVILDFFYKLPMNPEEAKATHYLRDQLEWKKVLPNYNKFFVKFNSKRNREVMHLSYKRLDVAPYDKKWNSQKLVHDIRSVVDLFLDHADPELVHPRLYELRSRKG